MRRIATVATVAAFAALALPAAASAETFDGQCQLTGTIKFGSPIGAVPKSTSFQLTTNTNAGRCTGTLDGQAVTNTPLVATLNGAGLLSCNGAFGQGGTGTLRFTKGTSDTSDDAVIDIVDFEFVSAAATIEYRGAGAGGGSTVGFAELLANASVGTIQQCLATSLGQATVTSRFTTVGPISG